MLDNITKASFCVLIIFVNAHCNESHAQTTHLQSHTLQCTPYTGNTFAMWHTPAFPLTNATQSDKEIWCITMQGTQSKKIEPVRAPHHLILCHCAFTNIHICRTHFWYLLLRMPVDMRSPKMAWGKKTQKHGEVSALPFGVHLVCLKSTLTFYLTYWT